MQLLTRKKLIIEYFVKNLVSELLICYKNKKYVIILDQFFF